MATVTATAAANRFGLGATADELHGIGADPRGWLRAQLNPGVVDVFSELPGSADYLSDYYAIRQARRESKKSTRSAIEDAMPERVAMPKQRAFRRKLVRESILRQQVAVRSRQPFAERIVRFWSNHFAISVDKRIAAPFAAPMEREAIRPHAFGKFADLLLAVERHPGMLLYLDNAQSIGNESRLAERAGRRRQANPQQRKRGLNENLARETLELHTLGVDGGYSQADVIELARAITGWSIASPREGGNMRGDGAFVFRANAHEPGARRVLGKAYADDGEAQGRHILHDLALHPATARHLSFKLARHFVADAPPAALVERMASAYLTSGGELTAMYRSLVDDDAAWAADARKFKTPDDFTLSAMRASGLDREGDVAVSLDLLARMGQPLFQPRSPAGFADTAADWSGPDALFKRVQAAQALAERVPGEGVPPLQMGTLALGPALDAETATALRRAESVRQGIALLLASPRIPVEVLNMDLLTKGIDRRRFLSLGAGATAIALLPRFAVAAASQADTRFLLVFLRGGLDGLHALQPIGDPAFAGLRGRFLETGKQPPSHRLDGTFALHGALGFMAELHARKQLLPVAAIAPPYRQRSHFEAQDCVENGTSGSGGTSGWMNRCIAAMPGARGLAVAAVMPLAMRGGADATTWSPPLPEQVDPILWQRLQLLYAADATLSRSFAELGTGDASADAMQGGKQARVARLLPSMTAAAKFMSAPQGPRIGFVEDTGWDTHGNEIGVLDRKLAELDAGLRAFHDGAQPIWRNTVVAIVTEFGRTAAINGTGGTDHGTGGSAFLAGGAVDGGRVAGDWPGIGKAQLNDGRDLRATTDMRSLFKGLLRDHLGIADAALAAGVFPDSGALPPMRDLVLAA